jgi:hypothetical protein
LHEANKVSGQDPERNHSHKPNQKPRVDSKTSDLFVLALEVSSNQKERSNSMKKMALMLGIIAMAGGVSQAQLNPSFEAGTSPNADNWTRFGNAYREGWAAHTGVQGMAFHGWEGTGGFFQDIAATAGITYSLSAWYQNDTIPTTAIFRTKIEWLDVSNAQISVDTLTLTGLNNTWQQIGFSALAPANTVTARMVFVVDSTANGGQTLKIDDVNFSPVPEPTVAALLGLGGLLVLFRRKKA